MQRKLTLSINEDLIEHVHHIAKKSNDTVSHVVSVFFEKLKQEDSIDAIKAPLIKKLCGSIKLKKVPDKKELNELYLKKHLR